MVLQTEKFKEALQVNDQLNIYAEFCNILKSIVDLSKKHSRLATKDEVMKAMSVFTELKELAFSLYEKLKDMNKEEILLELENMEELNSKAEHLLNSE